MLIAALLPMCDLRPLLGGEASRSALPDWTGPGVSELPSGDPEFVPWFGAVREGRPPARRGPVCRAKNALMLLSWPTGGRSPGPFRALARDLVADGSALVRFDLLLGTDPARRAELPGAAALAAAFARISVVVRQQRGHEPIELRHAGSTLARAYLVSTTPVASRARFGFDWVIAGDPVFFVQWSVGEGLSEEGLPAFQRVGRLAVARAAVPSAGPRSSVWFVRHDGGEGAAREANALRASVVDLCARRESLRAVLTRITERRVSPPPNAPRGAAPPGDAPRGAPPSPSDRLQTYLQRAVRDIDRRQRALPVSTELRRPAQGPAEVREEGGALVTGLDRALRDLDVRGNIRRNVTDWALRDSGAGSTESEPVLPAPREEPSIVPKGGLELLPGAGPGGDLPVTDVVLNARLAAVGRERVDPGEITTFVLDLRVAAALSVAGPAAATGAFSLVFEPGQAERRVFVSASSRDFVPLPGARWEKAFVLRRDGIEPGTWSFEGQAWGDRPSFALSVQIVVDGVRVGGLEVRLPRRGSPEAPKVEAGAKLTSPAGALGAALVVSVDREGPALVVKWLSPAGQPSRWAIPFDPVEHFRALGNARLQERKALHDYCRKLVVDLNKDLFTALVRSAEATRGVLVLSPTPMLPFELLPLGRNAPFLGTRCPVARWVNRPDLPVPRPGARRTCKVACIRPDYDARRALPSAVAEEDALRAWLVGRGLPPPLHVGDRGGFDALLDLPDVDLLHFAGHAEDQPPTMHLPDKDRITPDEFWDTPLARNRPLFFLNGCRAGMAWGEQPPSLGHMIESLLGLDFSGVVAPFLSVDSGAARAAAEAFYESLGRGETVAQAVQAIHARAESDPAQAATYMSYLAYVPPDLSLTWAPPGPAAPGTAPAALETT